MIANLSKDFGASIPLREPQKPKPPTFHSPMEERTYRKQRLAATFRIFCRFGFNEGIAGHITVRDPVEQDTVWINPFGMSYARIHVSDLVRMDFEGRVVEGNRPVNPAGYAIHGALNAMRPDVNATVHAHTVHGKAFASLGRGLEPITQDACYFYEDHVLFDYGGLPNVKDEGIAIANALQGKHAVILQNHGLITVGESIDAAAYWMISLDNACRVQMLAEGAGKPKLISRDHALQVKKRLGSHYYAWESFQALYDEVVHDEPDFLN